MPGVREFMNSATPYLKVVEKEIQSNPTGEFLVVFNKTRNNNAANGRPESGVDLPEAFAATAGRSLIAAKQLYTRTQWTGKVVAATKTKDSLVDAITYQTESAAKQHKHSKNRQLLGDERDALGFYRSGAGAASGEVYDQWQNVGGDFFQSGTTKVDLINGSTNAVRQASIYATRGAITATGRALTFKDSAGANLNLDAGATAGDYFVLSGAIAAGVSRQLTGLRAVVSAADPPLRTVNGLQNVKVADVPEFAASIVVAGGAASEGADYTTWVDLQYKDLQRVETEIERNSDEGPEGIALILTSPPGYDTYVDVCKTERITVNSMTLDGGFKGVSFNQKPLLKDKHWRLGSYVFFNPSSVKLFALSELDWDETGGSMFYRLNGGDRDALGATMKEYIEQGVISRNLNGALVGVRMLYN